MDVRIVESQKGFKHNVLTNEKEIRCQPHLWVHEKDAAATAYYLTLVACTWEDFESDETPFS